MSGTREGVAVCTDWRADVHYLPKPDPPQPVGFVNARCPKCHRVTSYLNFQITARITCTWTNCAYTWCESADRRVADRDRSDFWR